MGWEQDNTDSLAPRSYKYTPKWENGVERHPDKRPSAKQLHVVPDPHDKRYVRQLVEVTGEGVSIIKCRKNVLSGELEPMTIAFFTWEEIQFLDLGAGTEG